MRTILNELIFDINIFSRIRCLEKKALIKGAPIRHSLLMLNITKHKGILIPALPSIRMSWFPKLDIKILPAAKNNSALNNACAYKWNNESIGKPNPKQKTITPNCLKVDNATIFFKSFSKIAAEPPNKHVIAPQNNKIEQDSWDRGKLTLKRIIM